MRPCGHFGLSWYRQYNRPDYLEQTLRSVLAQNLGQDRMQILVVDNCSIIGDIEGVVRSVGGGRVEYFRQTSNVGAHANGETCLRLARGHWIHALHDDDMILPGFYATYERLINQYPAATLLFCPSIMIDASNRPTGLSAVVGEKEGPVPDFVVRQSVRNLLCCPSVVIPRTVYERHGGVSRKLFFGSDWELFSRAAAAGLAVASMVPAALYRFHSQNDSHRIMAEGTHLAESKQIIDCAVACHRRNNRLWQPGIRNCANLAHTMLNFLLCW